MYLCQQTEPKSETGASPSNNHSCVSVLKTYRLCTHGTETETQTTGWMHSPVVRMLSLKFDSPPHRPSRKFYMDEVDEALVSMLPWAKESIRGSLPERQAAICPVLGNG